MIGVQSAIRNGFRILFTSRLKKLLFLFSLWQYFCYTFIKSMIRVSYRPLPPVFAKNRPLLLYCFQSASTMSSSPKPKRRKTEKTESEAPYELIYWPGVPGRGEHVRLCFEATKTPYKDVSNESKQGAGAVLKYTEYIGEDTLGQDSNCPVFAPPILKHGDLVISQTPNILIYLAPKLGLVPKEDPTAIFQVNQLALTALDGLSNEAHDTHHPVAVMKYYEDQKDEAKKKAGDYINNRLPKFLGYFERVLKSESSKGGQWLYGGQLTFADLVLFQCVDGVSFAFPKAMSKLKEESKYSGVFALVERVKSLESIKTYLESDRRLKYSMGIYRHYPELDCS